MNATLFDWAARQDEIAHEGAEIINIMCTQAMTDRLLKDFWDRQYRIVRYHGPGHIISLEAERVRRRHNRLG